MSNYVIQVEKLSKVFRCRQKEYGFLAGIQSFIHPKYIDVTAVSEISFTVNPGEIIAFIGPNGAGKSTTIKMLTGILYPTSGDLRVLGYIPCKDRHKIAYSIGTVFGQKSQLWYHLAPIETFHLLARIYELDELEYQKRIKFLIDAFSVGPLLNMPVRKLSLGQRMRCEIVASLVHNPKIIFLDEPTIGLDVLAKQTIREVIAHLNQQEGVTIFLTSHDAGDVEALASRTIVINHGGIIFDDATECLRNRFLTTKVIEIIAQDSLEDFSFSEGKLLYRDKHVIKIELESQPGSLARLLNYATTHCAIKDITIVEPPMEEVIAHIYRASHDI